MRIARLLLMLGGGVLLAATAAMPATAAEARPWLCRDKPVFSFTSAMTYRVANSGGRRWRLLLMQFQEGGAHDGFDIVATRDLAPRAAHVSGSLGAGQYFAVAMYGRRGLWICPGYAHEKDAPPAGAVSQICYGDDPSDCPVTLTVIPATAAPQSAAANH
jgi:hypothetical protein